MGLDYTTNFFKYFRIILNTKFQSAPFMAYFNLCVKNSAVFMADFNLILRIIPKYLKKFVVKSNLVV